MSREAFPPPSEQSPSALADLGQAIDEMIEDLERDLEDGETPLFSWYVHCARIRDAWKRCQMPEAK